MVTVDIKGINRISNNLRTLAALDKTVLDPEMKDWTQDTNKLLKSKPYPPQRANQKYRRTGELANKWAADKRGTGVWAIVNRKAAAGWVVGDRQAWMHQGRWWQARPTIEGETPKLTKALAAKVEKVWQSGG